jgi:DNA invertase Pin-like site-specific DNA recombinase
VYVWRLDRFTRRGIADTFELVDGFRRVGAEVVSVTEGFNFGPPFGDVMVALMAWAAEMEGRAQLERVQGARARMAAEGRPWGRPPRVAPGSELESKIVALRAEKRSFRSIAMALKVPQTTVERAYARTQKTT